MAAVAASPASFQPSKPQIATGSTRSGRGSGSVGCRSGSVTGQAYDPSRWAGDRRLVRMPAETDPRSDDMPAAVLWDLDGTLLDSEKLWDIPLYELTEKLGGQLSVETRQAMVGTNVMVTMRLLYAEVGITDPGPEQLADGAAWIDRRMVEVFHQELPWRPGASDALATVHEAGIPMALVTSTERKLTEIALKTIGKSLFR